MIMRSALVSVTVLNLGFPVAGYSETRLLNREVLAFSDVTESSMCCSNEDRTFQLDPPEAKDGTLTRMYAEEMAEPALAPDVIAQVGGYEAAARDIQADQGNENLAAATTAEPPQSALGLILSAVMGFASSVTSQR
jgi:hypothetical protein